MDKTKAGNARIKSRTPSIQVSLFALRLRYGLHWRDTYPFSWRRSISFSAVLGLLFALYISFSKVEGQQEELAAARQSAHEARQTVKRVLDCLNGKPLGLYPNPSRGTYGAKQIAVMCRTEEIPI